MLDSSSFVIDCLICQGKRSWYHSKWGCFGGSVPGSFCSPTWHHPLSGKGSSPSRCIVQATCWVSCSDHRDYRCRIPPINPPYEPLFHVHVRYDCPAKTNHTRSFIFVQMKNTHPNRYRLPETHNTQHTTHKWINKCILFGWAFAQRFNLCQNIFGSGHEICMWRSGIYSHGIDQRTRWWCCDSAGSHTHRWLHYTKVWNIRIRVCGRV